MIVIGLVPLLPTTPSMRPPPNELDREMEGGQAIDARLLHQLGGQRVRQKRRDLLCELRRRGAMRFHAHCIDHRVGAPTIRQVAHDLDDAGVVLAQI